MDELVKQFLEYLSAQHTYSESTCMAYENDLRCYLGYLESKLCRPVTASDFNAASVAAFLTAERQSGRRQSTLLRRRASLRRFASFLNLTNPEWTASYGSEDELIKEAITAPALVNRPRYLNDEQVAALSGVMHASPRPRALRDQAILALLLESGLTVTTLIALNVQDVDLKSGKLRLCFDLLKRDYWLPLGEAEAPLRRYIEEGRPELNYHPEEPGLFISQTGGRMSRQGVWQMLSQWGQKAGLDLTLSSRLVRHTAAYRMAKKGLPLAEIQILLGHTNPLSTQALLRRLESTELVA